MVLENLISAEELVNINDIEYMLMKFAKVKNSDISEPKEGGLVYENPLLIDNGEKYEEKPQEVMPDCCKIHREEFMTTLKFDQFKQNEQKIPLILASNLALYDTSKISQKLADNSFNVFKVKNSDYDALDKISSENKYILNRYRFS
jgi:hypothetical protein